MSGKARDAVMDEPRAKPRLTLGKVRRPWTITHCECGERKVWKGDGFFPGVRFRVCPKCDVTEPPQPSHV